MKTKYFFQKSFILLFFCSLYSQSQVVNFDTEAWGFEKTNVEWSNNTMAYYKSPGDIVKGWTQTYGFTQSEEYVHTGKYSMKIDYKTKPVPNDPKLQTWRTNRNHEGVLNITAPGNYIIQFWTYVIGSPIGNLKITLNKGKTEITNANFSLVEAIPNKWTLLTYEFDVPENLDTTNLSSTINFRNPPIDCIVYIDDIVIKKKGIIVVKTEAKIVQKKNH